MHAAATMNDGNTRFRRGTCCVLSALIFCILASAWAELANAAEPAAIEPAIIEPDRPIWWPDAQREAERGGYTIIDDHELDDALGRPGAILVDVRPDYEFRLGHIPGAVNFVFELGDKYQMSAARREEFRTLLGEDLDRTVVLYCRDYRCLRSQIAAPLAVRLGYRKVLRYPAGYVGWLEEVCPSSQSASAVQTVSNSPPAAE